MSQGVGFSAFHFTFRTGYQMPTYQVRHGPTLKPWPVDAPTLRRAVDKYARGRDLGTGTLVQAFDPSVQLWVTFRVQNPGLPKRLPIEKDAP